MLSVIRAVVLVFMVCLVVVGGCGRDEPESAPTSGSDSRAHQPLSGRDVSRASDLVGVWMRVSEGELLGLEFLKGDQVIVTLQRGPQPPSMTMSYSVLDGSRLSVVAGGGATTLYRMTRSKDLLELTHESAGPEAKPQRFRLLASGQTLVEGLREQAAALQAERVARATAAAEFLQGDGLVITPEAGGSETWLMSMRIDRGIPEGGGGFEGVITLDPATGRTDVLRPVTVHQFVGSMAPADEVSNRVRMTIEIAPAHEPAGQAKVRGRVEFMIEGEIDRPEFSGAAHVADLWPGPRPAVLSRDKTLHGGPLVKLEAQRQAMLAALAEVTDVLGGRAVLRGEKTPLGGGTPEPIEVTIERAAAELTYTATVTVGGRKDQAANGAVGLVIGRGALYVNLPWGEQWRLHAEEGGKTLTGLWRPNTRSDFIGHGSVAVTVERTWTLAEVEAERAAIAKFVNEDLRTTRRFVGGMEIGRGDDREVWPVAVSLRVGADGVAEGELWSLSHHGGSRMSGKLAGGVVSLRATGYLDGSKQDRSILQQSLQLRVTGMDPVPTMKGGMRHGSRGGDVVLTLAAEGTPAPAALLESLRGRTLHVTNTTVSRPPEPAYIILDEQLAGGELAGVIVGYNITGSTSARLPPGLVRLSAAEEHGHALLKMVIDSSPEPVRGNESQRYEYTAVVERHDDGMTVHAWDAPPQGNITRLRLDPVDGAKPVAIDQTQRVRLAAQRMGAKVAAPTSPAVGDSVLLLIRPTERDGRLGRIWCADGRYCAGNSVAAAALHAGVLGVDEVGIVRLTYRDPFTAPTPPVEQNGITSAKGNFRTGNTVPTFEIERVPMPEE